MHRFCHSCGARRNDGIYLRPQKTSTRRRRMTSIHRQGPIIRCSCILRTQVKRRRNQHISLPKPVKCRQMDFRIISLGYISPSTPDILAVGSLFNMFLATFLHTLQDTILNIRAVPNLIYFSVYCTFFHILYRIFYSVKSLLL